MKLYKIIDNEHGGFMNWTHETPKSKNMLDTYFLAICHFGTSWDYVDSMVDDILGEA